MIAALAEGITRIENYSTAADCEATLSCLAQLGVGQKRDGDAVMVQGVGLRGLGAPAAALDCRNSGTTMRLLAGVLAGQSFTSIMTGDRSLRSRPMQRIVEPLSLMGAIVSSQDGCAPLVIEGQSLQAISYELLVASAQVKSCVLLAGLYAEGQTTVTENEPTRDHTERMLRWFGIPIETGAAKRHGANASSVAVQGWPHFQARDVSIPGDISSAAYFVAAAALLPGSDLEVLNVGVNPTRVRFLDELRAFGLDITVAETREESNEPVAMVRVRSVDPPQKDDPIAPQVLDGLIIPQLIDELPLLAVVGSQIAGGIEIRDASELRLKESDRIATTVMNLRAMGAEVEEYDDGLRVQGRAHLHAAKIDPQGDHRIAMAFSVAALMAEGESEIKDAGCVAVSFPEFFELLESVVER